MNDTADARRLRIADQDARDEATRLPPPSAVGAAALVCTVTTGSASKFCTCQPQMVTGAETTGAAGTLASSGGTLVALNLGGGNPTGKTVLVTFVQFRWVFRFD